jgi:pentatricopeptide repeat protein
VDAYETLMEAYASHMDMRPAEAILDRMQAAGLQPVMRSYNRLLHGVALNGDLTAAIRVYNRMKLQGLPPDIQTLRCLFKCVRMYASKVRVASARAISLQKAGDR